MRIGILGGTLDPVHNGHMAIAQAAQERLGLDQIMLLPSGQPPYKRAPSCGADRLRMAELAAESHAGFFTSDVEIKRGGLTYTVDTLHTLTVERPDVEWVYIVGADALNTLDQWREFPRIARLCAFAAVMRPGCDEALAELRAGALRGCYGARVEMLSVSGPEISSTDIRNRVARGQSIDGMVCPAVAEYIREHGLYLCDYSEPEVLDKLRGKLTAHRYLHTLGVADTAQRLAARYGVDPMRARLAGLLHDCAKSLPLDEMRALVAGRVPDMDEAEMETKSVLHAPAGSVMAYDEFGVRDPAILQAIRRHTLGGPDMTDMDALIYVSDFIEPGREAFPGLEKVRKLAEKDIYRAMRLCAELTAKHLKSRGQTIHPRTLQVLNSTQGGADK